MALSQITNSRITDTNGIGMMINRVMLVEMDGIYPRRRSPCSAIPLNAP